MQNLRFLPTKRNGVLLIDDDEFCYTRAKSGREPGTEYWKCDQPGKCPGRGKTKNNRREFSITQEHNHLPDKLRLEMRAINTDIKQAAALATNVNTANDIVQAVLMTASDAAKANLPNLGYLKQRYSRCKSKNLEALSLPLTRDDIEIPSEFRFNGDVNEEKNFLLWDSGPAIDGNERILLFGTLQNLEFLQKCDAVLMEGTFKITPYLFSELYTIHGIRLDGPDQKPEKAVPLLFFLLPDKKETTYVRAFNQLNVILPGWQPKRVMMNFDQIPMKAVRTQWPNSQIACCFYYLNQDIRKKIEELGLSIFHGENVENTNCLKMIIALAFVPPESVIYSWEELLQIFQPWIEQQTQDIQQKIHMLLAYFETNYIGEKILGIIRHEPCMVPIELWNVRSHTLENYGRLDNEIGLFHMKGISKVGAQCNHLWKFLKGLLGLQAETEKIIKELNMGGRKHRPEYIRLAERIVNTTANWSQKKSLESYLKEISYCFSYSGH